MSEPVKSVEIEDVLSSIRRLVSDDRRMPTPSGASEASAGLDRLVLTPALRVAEASAPDGDRTLWPQDHSEQDAAGTQARDAALWPLDEAAPEDRPADRPDLSQDDADQVQDTAEAQDARVAAEAEQVASEALAEDATEDLSALDTAEDTPDAPQDPAPWSDPAATLYSAAGVVATAGAGDEDLGVKIAKLEAVIAETHGHWEPDDPGTDDYAGTEVEKLDWSDTTGAPEPGPKATKRRAFVETLEDPDAPGSDTAPEAAPGVEPVFRAARRPAAEPAPDEDAIPDLAAQDTILDEATLRDLVAEIVREELQGALGERITRNVRKLVRREIHRALTMQNLD